MGLIFAISLAAAIELGRRTAAYLHIHDDANHKEQMVAIRDGLFVLVSLLLGFTLAVPRNNERRKLLVEKSISIETTYLRAIAPNTAWSLVICNCCNSRQFQPVAFLDYRNH